MGECMELYTPGAALFSILVPSTDFLCFLKSQVRMVVNCHCRMDRSTAEFTEPRESVKIS